MSQTTKAIITTGNTTEITEAQQQQAIDYAVEQSILERVHPKEIDRAMHRHGECDGSCVRAFNGMNLDGVDCR